MTERLVQALLDSGVIEENGIHPLNQKWRKPLTVGIAHAICTEALPREVVRLIVEEARRVLKGLPATPADEFREVLAAAWSHANDNGQ